MHHVSRVTCHQFLKQTATATDPPLGYSLNMQIRVVYKDPKTQLKKSKKSLQSSKKNPVFLNPNISDTPFDQRSLVHWEAAFPRCEIHTNTQTDIATYILNRHKGRFSENLNVRT